MEACSIEPGSDCPAKAPGMKDVAETVIVMLSNPNVQTVVVDRQEGQASFVLAFSVSWNEIRARVENRESLTKCLVAGGPVEEALELPPEEEDFFEGLDLPEDEGKEG
jgi:hypothetical protein